MIFEKSDSPEFHKHIDELLKKASKIVMAGIGLNLIKPESFTNLLSEVKNNNLSLEVYLGNPESHGIETRLIEEELGIDKLTFMQKNDQLWRKMEEEIVLHKKIYESI